MYEKCALVWPGLYIASNKTVLPTTILSLFFKLISLTENRIINKKISGITPCLNNEQAFKKSDVIIDFTVPKCTLSILKIALKLKKKIVIGTTGFTKKEEKLIINLPR